MRICRRRIKIDLLIEPQNIRHKEFKKLGYWVTSTTTTFQTQSISLQWDHRYDNILCLLLIRKDIQTNRKARIPLSYCLQIHPIFRTNTYTVKLPSDMFRWRPPPPSSGKTTPRPQNKTILGYVVKHTHAYCAAPSTESLFMSHFPRTYDVSIFELFHAHVVGWIGR